MSIKAKLKILLFADKITLAESEDSKLWHEVFTKIQGLEKIPADHTGDDDATNSEEEKLIVNFAKDIGIEPDILKGALDPSKEEPFIRLDSKCWEAIKKNNGERGPSAMAPSVIAGTALALWFNFNKIGKTTKAHIKKVLKEIDIRETNADRDYKM